MTSLATLISAAAVAAAALIATPAAAEDLWIAGYWRNGAWVVDADTVRRAEEGRTRFTAYFVAYDASGRNAYTRYTARAYCDTEGAYWASDGGLGLGGTPDPGDVNNVKIFVCASPAARRRGEGNIYAHSPESLAALVAAINAMPGPPA